MLHADLREPSSPKCNSASSLSDQREEHENLANKLGTLLQAASGRVSFGDCLPGPRSLMPRLFQGLLLCHCPSLAPFIDVSLRLARKAHLNLCSQLWKSRDERYMDLSQTSLVTRVCDEDSSLLVASTQAWPLKESKDE